MNLMSDDQTYTDEEIAGFAEGIQKLMGITKKDGRYVDIKDSPLSGDLLTAIHQAVVRDWETVRTRAKVWESDLSQGRKVEMVTLLNLVERLIHMETHADVYRPEEFMEVGDLLTGKVQRLYGG